MFFAKATSNRKGEVWIYEDIGSGMFGGLSAKILAEEVKKLGSVEELDVYINSPGGSVFEGLAIQNYLSRHPAKKTVYVDGIAASIASVIMLCGPDRRIAENAMVMIHDPWGMVAGTSSEMRKSAEALDKVRETLLSTYVQYTGKTEAKISELMHAETWFSAKEALEIGLVTSIVDAKTVSANFTLLDKFANTPSKIRAEARSLRTKLAAMDIAASKVRRASPG